MSSSRCRPPVRWALRLVVGSFVLALPSFSFSGCLDRPVTPTEPDTTNVVIEQIRQERIERIDLLFMIDNSISMADKQAMLASAVPQLVRRLVQPRCMDADGVPTGEKFPCASGSVAEFEPVVDIHVGVLTSSLGSHGGSVCADPAGNDFAHLLPSVRPALSLPSDGNGFLWWNPGEDGFGDGEVDAFAERFQSHVTAADENGCGFEASLESWYRFLVDPSPPAKVVKEGNRTVSSGVDETLLQQRRDFLRPDSLVAIVMLSDENDCSIRDSDVGWYVASEPKLAPGTSVCATNPNDACCRSCAQQEPDGPPAGCQPLCDDAACKPFCDAKTPALLPPEQDKVSLRCWQQKQRFGIDFLYPTGRYVNALSKQWLCPLRADLDPDGCTEEQRVENPLFVNPAGGPASRTPELVYLAGIVGVPWQDIATDETLSVPGQLDYLTGEELHQKGRWSWITAEGNAPPADPLMQESVTPRGGTHPSGQAGLNPAGPDSAAGANLANGHEWRAEDSLIGDLQYACVYPLSETRTCADGDFSCDCSGVSGGTYTDNKPLCQAADGSYSNVQRAAKAYPGLRQLEVLRDFGKNSIVGSICPKVLDVASSDYGYNPAVDAIVDKLSVHLKGRCLPRTLAIEDGVVACRVVEASAPTGSCSCDATLGRMPIESSLIGPVTRELSQLAACGPGSPSGTACDALCLCEIAPYEGAALTACQTEPSFEASGGWCYVDPAQDYPPANPGTEALIGTCETHERRLLRLEPQAGATALIACQGAAFE